MNKNVFLIVFLLIFTVSWNVFGQNVQELRVGSFLSGYLNHGQEVWYRVTTTGVGILTVETTGEIDTYLEIYDTQRNLISENDDGEDLNAKIIILAGAGKTYLFKLKGYDTDETGPYRINASFSAITNPNALHINSNLSMYIENSLNHLFSVQPGSNGILTVRTSGNDVDTVMQAYDDKYNFLSENDDYDEDDINSKIDILVKAGVNYFFTVRGFSGDDSGTYSISASLSTPPELQVDSNLNGYLEVNGKNWYSVQAVRSGSLIVEISSNFDTLMEAYDENFNLIAEDDDGGDDLNALIEINAKAGTSYFFLVSGYGPEDSGSFRISARSR